MAVEEIEAMTAVVIEAEDASGAVADAIGVAARRARADATFRPPNMLRRKAANPAATIRVASITVAATSAGKTTVAVSRADSNLADPNSVASTIAVRRLLVSPAHPLPLMLWKNPFCSPANRSQNIAASRWLHLLRPSSNRNITNRCPRWKTQLPFHPAT
jgi:hypothetical protein